MSKSLGLVQPISTCRTPKLSRAGVQEEGARRNESALRRYFTLSTLFLSFAPISRPFQDLVNRKPGSQSLLFDHSVGLMYAPSVNLLIRKPLPPLRWLMYTTT